MMLSTQCCRSGNLLLHKNVVMIPEETKNNYRTKQYVIMPIVWPLPFQKFCCIIFKYIWTDLCEVPIKNILIYRRDMNILKGSKLLKIFHTNDDVGSADGIVSI